MIKKIDKRVLKYINGAGVCSCYGRMFQFEKEDGYLPLNMKKLNIADCYSECCTNPDNGIKNDFIYNGKGYGCEAFAAKIDEMFS